jgi:conjugative transfer signal peptidase TraF
VGLYAAARGVPERGTIVLACLPPEVAAFARERGYVPSGGACAGGVVPIGKAVVAIAGDTVMVTASGLLVNGASIPNSRALATDRKGRPLPQLPAGRHIVGPGTVWVLSSYSPFSFDSRYFGAIKASDVRGRLQPLWTASY